MPHIIKKVNTFKCIVGHVRPLIELDLLLPPNVKVRGVDIVQIVNAGEIVPESKAL